MDEFIIKSKGYSDEIISAKNVLSAKRKYHQKHPLRVISGVMVNEPF